MFKKNLSVSKQIALRIVFFGLALSAFVFSFLIPIQIKMDRKHAIEHAHMVSDAIASVYQTIERRDQAEAMSEIMLDFVGSSEVAFVRIMGAGNRVLYSSDPSQSTRKEAYEQGEKQVGTLLYVTKRISTHDARVKAIEVVMDLKAIQSESKLFLVKLAFSFWLVILILAAMIGWMTHGIVGVRLTRLISAMGTAEKGSFLVRAKVDNMDEVGILSVAFNKLLSALTRMQVREIEWEHDLQEAHEQLSIKARLEQANQSLKRRIQAQELLMDAAHQLGAILTKESLAGRLYSLLKERLGWADFGIYLLSPENQFVLEIGCGFLDTSAYKNLRFSFGEGITGTAGQEAKPILVNNILEDDRVLFRDRPEMPKGSLLSIPMLYQGRVIGVMSFFHEKAYAFDEQDVVMLDTLGALVSISLKNAQLYEETVQLATTDPLTGLMNRRAMERLIANEIIRSNRFDTPMTLLMIDVDHFKDYNDRMGHVMGDFVLKEIASCLQESVRKVDGVARFGGEEFCVILPQTGPDSGLEVAQKLRIAVRGLKVSGASGQPLKHLSVSIGVAWYPDQLESNLIAAADRALYQAKRAGRDRVVLRT
ncbi:MAG: diguanylate cyclase [Myxococcaceae bacterium]|nr:diguanylate cyclase [Myxococcaceae bacterium]MBH2006241.1 diguanylate cyclase [Myxococcaceae bacterium]